MGKVENSMAEELKTYNLQIALAENDKNRLLS